VQLAYYSLAKELRLDKLILMRTAPGQSYVNPVERVMSVLNLALQGYATARGECSPAVESALKGASSMRATRAALSKAGTHVAGASLSPAQEWAAAMQIPIDIVASSFRVRVPTEVLHCTQQACNVRLSCSCFVGQQRKMHSSIFDAVVAGTRSCVGDLLACIQCVWCLKCDYDLS
jgi:hypothetical protein